MDNLEIQVWEMKEKTERWKEMLRPWYNFWIHETLNCCIFKELSDENKKQFTNLFKDMMSYDDTPCVVTWDKIKKQVAGFVLCTAEFAESTEKVLFDFNKHSFDAKTLQMLNVIGAFLEKIFQKADPFKKYQVEKLWVIQVTSVNPEYQRRGLANQMTARVLELAREKGIPLIVSESSSAYTQRSKIKNFQFEKVLECEFEGNYPLYSEMPDHIKETQKFEAFLAKRL